MIHVMDGFLKEPTNYRNEVLKLPFQSYDFGHCQFHGIAMGGPSDHLLMRIQAHFPHLSPMLTFFRKSPLGQREPHFIHADNDMGEWTGILYLNPEPPKGDGTDFWRCKGGAIQADVPYPATADAPDPAEWTKRQHVAAVFNRLLLFPASYFHSRALLENWGTGDDARLTQVVFGTGAV